MSNVNKVLEIARSYIGTREYTSKHTHIVNTFNNIYKGYTLKMSDAWCDAFVSVVFYEAGLLNLIGPECSCGRHIELLKTKGAWQENDDIVPTPGMLVLYDWDRVDGWPEHIGIVESISGSIINVIEGNYSNQVKRRQLRVGDTSIRGYGVPKFTGATPSPTPAPTPAPTPQSNILKVDGEWGQATTDITQMHFGTIRDGIVSGQAVGCRQYHYACLPSSWKYGSGVSDMIKAIQTYCNKHMSAGLVVDGDCGYNTIKAMQRLLNLRINANLTVDGGLGVKTASAWQRWMNTLTQS